jgi:hypothetical protein
LALVKIFHLPFVLIIVGNRYRWKENDPFGSDAVYNTIAFVKFGTHHLPDELLRLTAKQLSWFAYVMHLAMDGNRNMKESELGVHKKQMKELKRFIINQRHMLRRFELIAGEETDPTADALGDDLADDWLSTLHFS